MEVILQNGKVHISAFKLSSQNPKESNLLSFWVPHPNHDF